MSNRGQERDRVGNLKLAIRGEERDSQRERASQREKGRGRERERGRRDRTRGGRQQGVGGGGEGGRGGHQRKRAPEDVPAANRSLPHHATHSIDARPPCVPRAPVSNAICRAWASVTHTTHACAQGHSQHPAVTWGRRLRALVGAFRARSRASPVRAQYAYWYSMLIGTACLYAYRWVQACR